MRAYLANGRADPDKRSPIDGTLLLSRACLNGHLEVTRILVSAGATICRPEGCIGCANSIRRGLRNCEWHTKPYQYPCAPLAIAAQEGQVEIVRYLLAEAGPLLTEAGMACAMLEAALEGHSEVVKCFLEAGLDKDTVHPCYTSSPDGTTLHIAAIQGRLAVVEVLLAAGAAVDRLDGDGETSLLLAASQGHEAIVRRLLDAGADTTKACPKGRTALIHAANLGYLACVRALLDAGAYPSAADSFGDTALHHAAFYGQSDVVRCLLEGGAEMQMRNKQGFSPLHDAISEGQLECVQCLVEAGANKDVETASGVSPLFLAASNGHVEVAQYLLDAGGKDSKLKVFAVKTQ